jgi:hypothetical protein
MRWRRVGAFGNWSLKSETRNSYQRRSGRGLRVRLELRVKLEELAIVVPTPCPPARLTNWEIVHHLIRVLGSGGASAASELVAKLGTKAEMPPEANLTDT